MTTIGLSLALAALDELRDRLGAVSIVAAWNTADGTIELESSDDGAALIQDGVRLAVNREGEP